MIFFLLFAAARSDSRESAVMDSPCGDTANIDEHLNGGNDRVR